MAHVGSQTQAFASASGRRLNGVAELQAILASVRERGFAENTEETAPSVLEASMTPVGGQRRSR
jgi:DNA-binding IclR family transcriptional regulator